MRWGTSLVLGFLAVVAVVGCGSSKTLTDTVNATNTVTTSLTGTKTTVRTTITKSARTVTHTVTKTTTITHTTTSTAAGGSSVEGPGSYSHATDVQFCATHQCVENFSSGRGYIVQCADGSWSHSGGMAHACSGHGGTG
jgi:hypothetical protein